MSDAHRPGPSDSPRSIGVRAADEMLDARIEQHVLERTTQASWDTVSEATRVYESPLTPTPRTPERGAHGSSAMVRALTVTAADLLGSSLSSPVTAVAPEAARSAPAATGEPTAAPSIESGSLATTPVTVRAPRADTAASSCQLPPHVRQLIFQLGAPATPEQTRRSIAAPGAPQRSRSTARSNVLSARLSALTIRAPVLAPPQPTDARVIWMSQPAAGGPTRPSTWATALARVGWSDAGLLTFTFQ